MGPLEGPAEQHRALLDPRCERDEPFDGDQMKLAAVERLIHEYGRRQGVGNRTEEGGIEKMHTHSAIRILDTADGEKIAVGDGHRRVV